jgi:arylsulfatase A-like enzyme
VRTLAELLRAAGYRTGAVTEDGFVDAARGFARGFGSFTGFTRLTEGRYPAGMVSETFDDGMRWIMRERDRPWFLFLHTYEVHAPYDPPPKDLESVVSRYGPYRWVDLYDGEIRHTDTTLAKLLTFLRSAGLHEETLVVLTSDHGEQFGQHEAWGHGNTLYNAVLHVPLILRAPGIVPAGRRIAEVVGLIDILPTVLDVVGLPPHPAVQGRSLAPLWRGESLPARTLYAEEHALYSLVAAFAAPHKWIFSTKGGQTQAFDFVRDPDETRNLAETIGNRGEPLLAEFRSMCAANAREAPPAPKLDPLVEDKLRALGYVE